MVRISSAGLFDGSLLRLSYGGLKRSSLRITYPITIYENLHAFLDHLPLDDSNFLLNSHTALRARMEKSLFRPEEV